MSEIDPRRWMRALALSAALALCGCGQHRTPPSAEERAVYSAALRAVFTRERGFDSVQVMRTTAPPGNAFGSAEQRLREGHAGELAGLKDETIRSFVERNRMPRGLPQPLSPGLPYIWVSKEDIISEHARAHTRGDGGFVRVAMLSAAGYDRQRTQALVYVVDACGMCGHAEWVLLGRTPQGWVVAKRSVDWSS